MAEKLFRGDARYLFFIPSFYGAITWGAWLVLYLAKLVGVDDPGAPALTVFILAEVLFILSAAVSLPYYRDTVKGGEASGLDGKGFAFPRFILALLHGAGFAGIALYVVEFSRNLGGLAGFFLALVNEAYAIRWETETSASIGTQLSYFGWMAIALTAYLLAKRKTGRFWIILAALQFAGNLMFIDRTRPTWIVFTCILMLVAAMEKVNLRKMLGWMAAALTLTLLMFWGVAEWTGKTATEEKYENSLLPGITQEIYVYGVSGFAYFNRMLESNEQISYSGERVLYPLAKYLARFGVSEEPPSQVLEFYDVPFTTNVGTFLEPFYRDGGMAFVIWGILLYSFGFDLTGLLLLKSGKLPAIFAWSNLCFASFIGFFTPKVSSLPIWLFVTLGVASLLFGKAGGAVSDGMRPAAESE